ncbi:hypothetical protein CPB85DRAFT_1453163 [Mucidula mucida]|nr:hypothetical protein CPB85DRAFT_1453163 [Mucidula mucida]
MSLKSTPQLAIESHLNTNIDNMTDNRLPLRRERKRTLSTLSTVSARSSKVSVQSKADPSVVVASRLGHEDAYGAFAPTAPATSTLHQFTKSSNSGGFFRGRSRPTLPWLNSSVSRVENPWNSSTIDSPSSIPSISRTSSLSDTSEYTTPLPDTPSDTASLHRFVMYPKKHHHHTIPTALNPILAALERKSKLCTFKAHCATCGKPGNDYPRCGRCGETWCSRECRTHGGKRHVCVQTKVIH